MSAHACQSAIADPSLIIGNCHGILDVALRQLADRSCTKADESGSRVCGIALEIAPHRPGGQWVGWQCVMVEPDADITCRSQALRRFANLREPRRRVGKSVVVNQALVRNALWEMRVTKQSNPVGLQFQDFAHRLVNRFKGLEWKSIDQIDIYAFYAMSPQRIDNPGCQRKRLLPVDGVLHRLVEVLYANTDAIDAGFGKSLDALFIKAAT